MNPTTDEHYAQGYFRVPDGVSEPAGKFSTQRNHPDRIGKKSLARMKPAAE